MKGHIRKATVALAAASVLGFVGCSGSSAEPSPADPTETGPRQSLSFFVLARGFVGVG